VCLAARSHVQVELTCEAPELDSVGRVIDFGVMKAKVGGWIDEHMDHTTLVNSADKALLEWCFDQVADGKRKPYVMPGEPTAENIAAHLMAVSQALLGRDGLRVVRVRVWETANCFADAIATDMVGHDDEVRDGRGVQDAPG
jgi:6-pyruvoyltetrahydropterin/6-carboxytetrahydropterin synthase